MSSAVPNPSNKQIPLPPIDLKNIDFMSHGDALKKCGHKAEGIWANICDFFKREKRQVALLTKEGDVPTIMANKEGTGPRYFKVEDFHSLMVNLADAAEKAKQKPEKTADKGNEKQPLVHAKVEPVVGQDSHSGDPDKAQGLGGPKDKPRIEEVDSDDDEVSSVANREIYTDSETEDEEIDSDDDEVSSVANREIYTVKDEGCMIVKESKHGEFNPDLAFVSPEASARARDVLATRDVLGEDLVEPDENHHTANLILQEAALNNPCAPLQNAVIRENHNRNVQGLAVDIIETVSGPLVKDGSNKVVREKPLSVNESILYLQGLFENSYFFSTDKRLPGDGKTRLDVATSKGTNLRTLRSVFLDGSAERGVFGLISLLNNPGQGRKGLGDIIADKMTDEFIEKTVDAHANLQGQELNKRLAEIKRDFKEQNKEMIRMRLFKKTEVCALLPSKAEQLVASIIRNGGATPDSIKKAADALGQAKELFESDVDVDVNAIGEQVRLEILKQTSDELVAAEKKHKQLSKDLGHLNDFSTAQRKQLEMEQIDRERRNYVSLLQDLLPQIQDLKAKNVGINAELTEALKLLDDASQLQNELQQQVEMVGMDQAPGFAVNRGDLQSKEARARVLATLSNLTAVSEERIRRAKAVQDALPALFDHYDQNLALVVELTTKVDQLRGAIDENQTAMDGLVNRAVQALEQSTVRDPTPRALVKALTTGLTDPEDRVKAALTLALKFAEKSSTKAEALFQKTSALFAPCELIKGFKTFKGGPAFELSELIKIHKEALSSQADKVAALRKKIQQIDAQKVKLSDVEDGVNDAESAGRDAPAGSPSKVKTALKVLGVTGALAGAAAAAEYFTGGFGSGFLSRVWSQVRS